MRPAFLFAAALAWALPALAQEEDEDVSPSDPTDLGVDVGVVGGVGLVPVVRARPGLPLVAAAGGHGVLYVVDAAGALRVSSDGGRTFLASRRALPASGPGPLLPHFDDNEDESDEDAGEDEDEDGDDGGADPGDPFSMQENYGWVGENVYLDFDRTWFFRQSAADLFAFPYGTTGEAYLEFQPDSPAFWDPPWVSGMPRPDVRYFEPRLAAPRFGSSPRRPAAVDGRTGEGWSVVVDAADRQRAFISNRGSVERSDDGGAGWSVLEEWAWADVDGALLAVSGELVLAAGGGSLFVSRDGGASFVQEESVRDVVAAAVDPRDPLGWWLATERGLLRSTDAGRSFEMKNADIEASALVVNGAGQVFVAQGRRLLHSNDGGATFSILVDVDDEVVALVCDAESVYVLSAGALWRTTPAPAPPTAAALAALRRVHARAPTLAQVLQGAQGGLSPAIENPAAAMALLPRIDVVGGVIAGDSTAVLGAVFLDTTTAGDGDFVRQTAEAVTEDGKGAAFRRRQPSVNPYVAVLLSWDLPELLAPSDPASSAARRRQAQAAFNVVEHEVTDAWHARQQALEDLALLPADDAAAFLQRALDVAELNARLEALGGLPFPALGGDAGRALHRLPESVPVGQVVDDAASRWGLGAARLRELRSGAGWRPALPTVLVSASFAESHLDEDDFLDEVGLQRPWITKSAFGQAWDVSARLAWDLPHTLRSSDVVDLHRLQWLRHDLAADVGAAFFELKRAQARRSDDDVEGPAADLAVDELGALLAGLSGHPPSLLSRSSP